MKRNSEFVGVDEKFIPEDEKYVDEAIIEKNEENQKKAEKIVKKIGTGYLIFLVFIIVIFISIFAFVIISGIKMHSAFSKQFDAVSEQFNEVIDNK